MGLVLALLLAQASPVPDVDGPIFTNPATMGGASLAYFEFAPASGAGMGSACACTAVTGAKGEAMTFARSSTATCPTHGHGHGIANGDFVTCAANQPRVAYPNGTPLRLLLEGARTNTVLRSQELDNASWGLFNSVCSAITRTANFAVAPDGTTTAERLQVPACSGAASYTFLRQSLVIAAGSVCGAYVRSNTGAGAQTIHFAGGGSGSSPSTPCSAVEGSWTHCTVAFPSADNSIDIGTNDYLTPPGAGGAPAADVLVWGVQCEAATWASTYIPTTSAAVTRSAESASFTVAAWPSADFSLAATAEWTWSTVGAVNVVSIGTAAPALARIGRTSNTAAALTIDATSTTPAVSAIVETAQRAVLVDSAGTRSALWQGASVAAPAASMTSGATSITLGVLDGYVGAVCADPSPTRCAQ